MIFRGICDAIKKKEGRKVTWVPTVVFDIEGAVSPDVIKQIGRIAKQMSSDTIQARCILVFETVHHSYLLPYDEEVIQEKIWVNDLKESEANQYLDKLGFTTNHEIRRIVFDKYGTKPTALRDLATSKMKPLDHIEKRIETDMMHIHECLIDDKNDHYRYLLKDMLKHENGIHDVGIIHFAKIDLQNENSLANRVFDYDDENYILKFKSKSIMEATKRWFEMYE